MLYGLYNYINKFTSTIGYILNVLSLNLVSASVMQQSMN